MDIEYTNATVEEIILDPEVCPLPLSVIPNHMGINLCAVESVSWARQADGQLVSFSVFFKPEGEGK